MYSDQDTACAVGCPIRRSRDQRLLASPPGLSQRATSFIASQCQGIHQMPLIRASCTTPNGKNHLCRSAWQTLHSEDTYGAPLRDEAVQASPPRNTTSVTQLASLQFAINNAPRFPRMGWPRAISFSSCRVTGLEKLALTGANASQRFACAKRLPACNVRSLSAVKQGFDRWWR
jgi:hypothetical protein